MTLLTCVMAWGANVAQIGETIYTSFNTAFAAATEGQTIVLLADIAKASSAANETRTVSANITIDGQGQYSISRAFIIAAGKTLTLKDVTVSNKVKPSNSRTIFLNKGAKLVMDNATIVPDVASCVAIGSASNAIATIELNAGTTNSISNISGSSTLYAYGTSGKIVITGDGALQVNHVGESGYLFTAHTNTGCFAIDAKNAAFTAANEGHLFGSLATMSLSEGVYSENPTLNRVAVGSVLLESGDDYKVFAITDESADANGVVATIDRASYVSLAAALSAAPKAALITLWADAPAATINQSVVINKNGFNVALTAGTGYVETVEDSYYIYAADASEFAAFLAAEGEASYTLTEDIDISLAGTLPVNGTKTLTIPAGKKIFYQRQGLDANILVNEGAKLTILGNGSVEPAQGTEMETSADMFYQMGCWALRVDGELVVGVEDEDQPHFVSTAGRISGVDNFHGAPIYITENGKATINNIDINAAQATFWNAGETTINGGEFISVSSSQSGLGKYSYALQNYGKMVINDIHVQGTHGGFACQNFHTDEDVATGFAEAANTVIYGGTFETVHGKNFITGVDNAKDNYYAMYVSNFGIVNVYGGKFKVQTPSAGSNRVVLIGNNDYYNSYGVVNFYGGMYAEKAYVTKKKNAESAFPPSIPLTSAWYSAFEVMDAKNAYAPLPAGYEYQEITSGADYDAGYRWQVVCTNPNTDAIDEDKLSEPTIPWQQATTWATDEVPEENTIVTIPAGATVVVSNAAADIAAGGKEAVADQIFVNQGASVTVQTGTALTVGDGGVNIANGGSITVEPGAVVKIGEAGIITSEEDALVLESTEDAQAILLYNPAVTENTQPKATVKLTTKSKMLAGAPTWQYTYQRFAIPVKEAMIPANDFDPDHDELFSGEEAYGFESYVYYWTGHNWANCTWGELVPFKGYQLANNSKNGGVTYTFNGNLFGNEDKAFEFQKSGFDYFGNSYTAPINVQSFLSGFGADVEATIWLYNYDTKNWQQVALEDIEDGFVEDEFKQIKSMDGFLLNLRAASGSAPVDYASAIWANPLLPAHAPARNKVTNEINNSAVITIKDNAGFGDNLTLVEKDNYTNAFENGADATKYILAEGVSLYAETQEGKLGRVATNNLSNTIISFRSGDNSEYTMTFGKVNGEDYLLRDKVTGMTIAIAEGATYTFTQEANTTVPARFEIVGRHNTPTAIENVEAEAKAHGIYSIAGQFLGNDFTVLPAGVYVVNGVKIVK